MPITAEQLQGLATGFHTEAENHLRANGKVIPALRFIPDTGAARLVAMPNGVIDHAQTAAIARTDRPSAILLTGESWLGTTTIAAEKAAKLPLDDLPRPSEQPDRQEVILTRGVGRGPDGGLLHAMRTILITRSVFGTQLQPLRPRPSRRTRRRLRRLPGRLAAQTRHKTARAAPLTGACGPPRGRRRARRRGPDPFGQLPAAPGSGAFAVPEPITTWT